MTTRLAMLLMLFVVSVSNARAQTM